MLLLAQSCQELQKKTSDCLIQLKRECFDCISKRKMGAFSPANKYAKAFSRLTIHIGGGGTESDGVSAISQKVASF